MSRPDHRTPSHPTSPPMSAPSTTCYRCCRTPRRGRPRSPRRDRCAGGRVAVWSDGSYASDKYQTVDLECQPWLTLCWLDHHEPLTTGLADTHDDGTDESRAVVAAGVGR